MYFYGRLFGESAAKSEPGGSKMGNNKNSEADGLRQEMANRDKLIVKVSITGIITNIFLVIFKITIGLLSSSISVVLDGINNLTDVISSIVTIVGTKLASRKPDKKHPLGHGRIEYIATMIVAAIILYAGTGIGVDFDFVVLEKLQFGEHQDAIRTGEISIPGVRAV